MNRIFNIIIYIMAASVDLDADSTYLLNKYFILPVLSLNASVTNLDSNITTFTNLSSVIANASSIAILNASTLANTSSITTINASILANTSSIMNLNSSINASIADINTSIIGIKTTVSTLNTSLSNLSNYVTNFNSSVNASVANINTSVTNINTSVTNINTSVTNINTSVSTINTSLRNAVDTVNSTSLTIGGTNGTSTQSYAGSITSGTLSIGNSVTTGNISVGSANASNQVNVGGVLVGVNAINAGTNGTNFQIASTNTSGSISIGSAQTSGVLNIGTNSTRTSTGFINIGNSNGNQCPVNIMSGGGATTGGSVNIANGSLQTTTINIASGSGGTGTVTIGNISNTTTLNSASINVNGNLIMGGGKKIQTANLDALTAGGTVELANSNAGAVYIGASGVRNVITSIGTGSGTGSINLGNTTNVVNVYGNLIMGTGRNITLQPPTGYVAPSSNTQLGFSAGLPGVSFSSAATNGNTIYCYSPPNGTVQNFLVAGVYLMSGYAFAFFTGTVSACAINMDIAIVGSSATPSGTGSANGLFNTRIAPQINTPTGDTRSYFPTYTFTVVTHQYYYLSCGVSSVSITGGGTVSCGVQLLSLVRIA